MRFAESNIRSIGDLEITATDHQGLAADFSNCTELGEARGSFPGFVDFAWSGIETIGDLDILNPDEDGLAASFSGCLNLKVARGRFPGCVWFDESGIETIGDLEIAASDVAGIWANFDACPSLRLDQLGTLQLQEIVEKSFLGIVTKAEKCLMAKKKDPRGAP